jgi:MFS family permease
MRQGRRNVLLMAGAQGLAVTGTVMVTTAAALAGHMLAVDKSLATLPVAFQFTATMATTIPASLMMARIGRRGGFMVGALAQLVGALSAAGAIALGSFWLFCLAGGVLGAGNAIAQFYRFAAAEAVEPAFRPKAISYVLAGGVIAALFGPELAQVSRDWLQPYTFAGIFLLIGGLAVTNIALIAFLDIPRPTFAALAGGRPMVEIARQPVFIVAVLGGMIAYGVMILVMTATPLAMSICGHDFGQSAFVIQWHVLGMFAPAFVTGSLIQRFGVLRIMQIGAMLLLGSAVANLSGVTVAHFWTGLVLLGVGWNMLFVGATTLLTEAYRPEERAKVQAINDFLVFGTSAAGSFAAGALLHGVGWSAVNWGIGPLILATSGALLWLARLRAAPRPA